MIWTECAEADLEQIWRYTHQQWGEEQADLYLSRLHAAIEDERNRKLRARELSFVSPGCFRMRQIRHFIYFRNAGEDVVVLRVLHDSMDETLHLP